ncbi:histidinol-phosphate transaminase [Kaarinaea lacus]
MSGNKQSISSLIEQWIRPEVRSIAAYHVPDSGGMVKLDAMENPYGWPESISGSWLENLKQAEINRYPDPGASQLKQSLKIAFALPENSEVLLGNGSDELIQMIAMALAGPDRVVLSVEPSFVMYRMIALMVGMEYVGVPLNDDYSVNIDSTLTAIKKHNPAVIFLAYPNNPTGNLYSEDAIRSILETTRGLVVVDEAYYAFAGASLVNWLDQYSNLLVMRTVSKMGMAGLRLGYLIGDCQWLEQIDKMRLPYNVGVLTQVTAQIALQHIEVFNQQTEQICKDREALYTALTEIDELEVYETRANFILFRLKNLSSGAVFEALKSQGVLIKNLGDAEGPLHGCLRVTVGTADENQKFLHALKHALQ